MIIVLIIVFLFLFVTIRKTGSKNLSRKHFIQPRIPIPTQVNPGMLYLPSLLVYPIDDFYKTQKHLVDVEVPYKWYDPEHYNPSIFYYANKPNYAEYCYNPEGYMVDCATLKDFL